jgi:hypothetical protein
VSVTSTFQWRLQAFEKPTNKKVLALHDSNGYDAMMNLLANTADLSRSYLIITMVQPKDLHTLQQVRCSLFIYHSC